MPRSVVTSPTNRRSASTTDISYGICTKFTLSKVQVNVSDIKMNLWLPLFIPEHKLLDSVEMVRFHIDKHIIIHGAVEVTKKTHDRTGPRVNPDKRHLNQKNLF